MWDNLTKKVIFFALFIGFFTLVTGQVEIFGDEVDTVIELSDVDVAEASTTYLVNTYNVTAGTSDVGNYTDLWVANDGFTANVSEATGSSPLIVIMNFTEVDTFNTILMRVWYDGGSGHQTEVGLWDYDDSQYEEAYGSLTDMSGFAYVSFDVYDPTSHIEDGIVSLRLDHTNNGIASHDLFLDYVVLIQGTSVVTVHEHDALSGRNDILTNHPNSDDIFCLLTGCTVTGALLLDGERLTIDNDYNDKIIIDGAQADPHTILVGGLQGLRIFSEDEPGVMALFYNNGNITTPGKICDSSGCIGDGSGVVDIWVNESGDTMTGDLIVPNVNVTSTIILDGGNITGNGTCTIIRGETSNFYVC